MTLKARVIPCLDVKDGRVVKGVNFIDLIDAGDPVEAAKAYDAAGADDPPPRPAAHRPATTPSSSSAAAESEPRYRRACTSTLPSVQVIPASRPVMPPATSVER